MKCALVWVYRYVCVCERNGKTHKINHSIDYVEMIDPKWKEKERSNLISFALLKIRNGSKKQHASDYLSPSQNVSSHSFLHQSFCSINIPNCSCQLFFLFSFLFSFSLFHSNFCFILFYFFQILTSSLFIKKKTLSSLALHWHDTIYHLIAEIFYNKLVETWSLNIIFTRLSEN